MCSSDLWNNQRQQVAKTYSQLLAGADGVIVPKFSEGHVFHQYTVRVLGGKRDQVKQALAEAGIGAMIYYPIPQDKLPIYLGLHAENPVSNQLGQEVLSLPMWPELISAQIETVATALKSQL